MTQTGKCDTCRQRKVKCDEEKPKCGACRKKDRPCTYSYGKASAFVVQDPNQLTKHGKSKIAPVVYTMNSSEYSSSSAGSTPLELRVSTQRKAEFGSGTFQTLSPVSVAKVRPSKKVAAHRRKELNAYLRQLQLEASLAILRPSCAESTLISRWIDMLGSAPANSRPLSILGTWIQSIPSRVGSNPMLDLAVEFLIDSHAVYWDNSYSKRLSASATRSKALRELQLGVSQSQTRKTYEMVLATKIHYAAETLLGVDTMYHAIHAFGLAELLKAGNIANVDDEHYWNLIDNAYIDDVNEAMLAGRASVYDNDYYVTVTFPPALASGLIQLTPCQRASMAIMHVFVQCPRLNCMVRHAIMHPDDTEALAAAVTMTEYMWQIDLPAHVAELLQTAITAVDATSSWDMADILTEQLHYDSVQSMILCTRYWMLQNVLCGLTDTLQRHFPAETNLSQLPPPLIVREFDAQAGIRLAESLPWAESVSQRLPLVPLRLHTPLQISIGPWHRTIRNMTVLLGSDITLDIGMHRRGSLELDRAMRMKTWLVNECNRIHEQWDVSTVDEKSLYEALDSMAGEQIPDWLPTRVRFEAEDGEMLIKLDYEKPDGDYQRSLNLEGSNSTSYSPRLRVVDNSMPNSNVHGVHDDTGSAEVDVSSASAEEVESSSDTRYTSPRAADFLFQSGRNLCQTSGWWPTSEPSTSEPLRLFTYAEIDKTSTPCTSSSSWNESPKSSIVLLDSTHKTSAFQPKARRRNPNGCLSPAWRSTETSSSSNYRGAAKSASPASASDA
ncbi:zn 2cys6 transcription factor [Stagonosporopsis vannaccii]|nr:zn 2cys6 transcription factor [Stagonosporopsis vannaccii]